MIVLALQENDFKVDDGEFFAFTQKPLSDLKEPRILAVYRTMCSSLGILYIIAYILLWLLLEKLFLFVRCGDDYDPRTGYDDSLHLLPR